VNAGGFAYTDGSGNYWAADQAYGSGPWGNTGGSPFSTGDPIANTTDDVLYQSERFGNFGYKFDVPNGKYDVAVHLAEIWFSSAGQRFFKILIEGAVVLDNYDIFTEVGHDTAIIKTFYSIDVQDGQLNVDFVPISNNAKVSAIAISPARPTKLAITSVNAGNTVTAGVGFPVVVQAQNPNGAPTNVTVSTNVSLSVKSGAGNLGGTISGTIPVGASQITFSGVTYSKADQGVVLTATATSGEALVPGDSAPFSVVVGSPNKLGIIFQPVNSTTSGAIKGPPTVAVQDSAGNTITSSSAAITVAIATNPGSGTLTGTTVRNAASGVGAFADLKIDQTGNGYTLAATSPGLTSATTAAFNITTGGNVAGTVTKAAGGGAITGASVEALQAGVVKGTASTNSAGSYTISGLAPGTYDIRADAGGFSPQTQSGVTVNAGATATANFSLAVATATAGIVYIYDELQRLKSVIDPVGEAATYAYDAVGNLLTIARNNASQVSVLDFNPNSGAVGSTVTIYGTGYSATPSQNSVTFNGIAAPVTSSTLTQIVTTVPAGATTGPIAVTSPAGSATSGTNFTVSGAEGAPTIANFSPTIGTAGTPVTISGTNFESVAIDNDVRFNRFLATVSAATSTSLSTTVPSTTTSGRISVTTRLGTAVSSADFVIPPSPYTASDVEFTGRMTIGGASFTATINTVGKIALVLFDGTAGEKVGFAYSNNTFTNLAGNILRPDGSVLASLGNFLSLTLPVTGTYTILLRPGGGTNVGSVTFTLSDELDAGSAVINGASKTVTIDRIGQRARVTFSGTAGELFGIGISSNTFTNLAADILRPDGAFFASFGSFVSLTLPVTGTYTILFRPSGTGVGSVTFLMTDEQDAGGFAINGPSKSVTIDRIGQRARVTFTGTAGELVGIGIVSNTFTNLAGDIKRPDGSVFASFGNFVSLTLPDTGTYTILFRPTGTGVGSVNFIMTDEQDAGSFVINGDSKTVTIDRIGQRARVTFTGTAGELVGIGIVSNTFTNLAGDIKRPDGSVFASFGNFVSLTLPDTGTYTILFRPSGTGVGSVSFIMTDEQDAGSVVINGASKTVTIDRIGQRARITFTGTATHVVTIAVSNSTFTNLAADIKKPDGTILRSDGWGTGTNIVQTLPDSGTYTILIRPDGTGVGSVTFAITE
jgi:YD repeat-containing protein